MKDTWKWLPGINLAFHRSNFKFAEFQRTLIAGSLKSRRDTGATKRHARQISLLPSRYVPSEFRATRAFRRPSYQRLLAVYRRPPPGLSVFHGFVANLTKVYHLYDAKTLKVTLYFGNFIPHIRCLRSHKMYEDDHILNDLLNTGLLKIKQLVFLYKLLDV